MRERGISQVFLSWKWCVNLKYCTSHSALHLTFLSYGLTNHSVVSGEKQVSGIAEIEDHFHNLH